MRYLLILAVLGVVAFICAGVLVLQEQSFQRESITAPGVVTRLNAGPLHADVEVTPATGSSFVYAENGSHDGLSVGQKVVVRYLASSPGSTPRLADASPYGTAWTFALIGVILLIAGAFAPRIAAKFPKTIAMPIR